MRAYLALTWHAADHVEEESARQLRSIICQRFGDWSIEVDISGLFVVLQPRIDTDVDNAYVLPEKRGVVIGRLFEYAYVRAETNVAPQPISFSRADSLRLTSDNGSTFSREYWGRYVAFLSDHRGNTLSVLRDPSGQIPCQYAEFNGVDVYFARLRDLDLIKPRSTRINRHFLIGWLALRSWHSGETGYEDIKTILPGERITHCGPHKVGDFFWNPLKLATAPSTIDFGAAKLATRRIVRSCCFAWASCFNTFSLQLSGGLDSSIVASCFASSPTRPRILCVNFYQRNQSTDERVFARQVARKCGLELREVHEKSRGWLNLDRMSERALMPGSVVTTSTWEETWRDLRLCGVEAHIRGDGGDELFYRDGILPDAVDHAFLYGMTPALWRVAWNDALIGQTSVWEVLRKALRYGALKAPYRWRSVSASEGNTLLTRDVKSSLFEDKTYWHPLFREETDCPPAKLSQAYRVLNLTNTFYAPPSSSGPLTTLKPLLSQPHLEASMSTPLFVLRAGGRDRSVARNAFDSDIPAGIVNRKHKSLARAPAHRLVAESATAIRKLLCDGFLAREKIIDVSALERMLGKSGVLPPGVAAELLTYVFVETWVRDVEGSTAELVQVANIGA